MRKRYLIITLLIIIFTCRLLFSDENNISNEDNEKDKDLSFFNEEKMNHESNNPVFCQKGGMLRKGEHSFYLRTNDEWTGFSTFMSGYRFGASEWFNIAIEGGASPIPHVYLAAVLLHFKFFESRKNGFFFGSRVRFGYKYQDSDFSSNGWQNVVGNNYLTVQRNGLYLAIDLTVAARFTKYRDICIYYTIYPRFDFDFFNRDYPVIIMLCPIMAGFEVRFPRKYKYRWSFAIEGGYVFPIPFNSIPAGTWVNFPCLANISFNYRFGDKFYSKENLEKYGIHSYKDF